MVLLPIIYLHFLVGVLYQSGLEEFLSYLSALMEEAFYPYAGVYQGNWNATELRRECEKAFAEAFASKEGYERIGRRLAETIDEKTLEYLLKHVSGLFYGPDLAVFGQNIGEKLREITTKSSIAR